MPDSELIVKIENITPIILKQNIPLSITPPKETTKVKVSNPTYTFANMAEKPPSNINSYISSFPLKM